MKQFLRVEVECHDLLFADSLTDRMKSAIVEAALTASKA